MLHHKNINEAEAPSLRDITMHYIPNIFFVTLKNKKLVQKRTLFKRHNRRSKLKLITLENYKNRTLMYIDMEIDG